MYSKKITINIVAVILATLFITACGKATPTEDPSLKITSIAATVQAELTQIAALTPSPTSTFTPTVTATIAEITATPELTMTPTMGAIMTSAAGDNAKYVNDITIPDGAMVKPGSSFTKTWSIQNTGTTTWTKDYQIVYLDGPQGTALSFKLTKEVAPGELVEISVPFVAPTALGTYTSWWTLYSASGYSFGEPLYVQFVVGTDTATPTSSTPSGTSTTTPTETVTSTP